MGKKTLFETMIILGAQLKGGPLTDLEKQEMNETFRQESGPAFDRATTALSRVLNSNPSLIINRTKALSENNEALKVLQQASKNYEKQS